MAPPVPPTERSRGRRKRQVPSIDTFALAAGLPGAPAASVPAPARAKPAAAGRPARILTLCYEHPPFGGGGGKVARGLAERLSRQGFRTDLVTMRFTHQLRSTDAAGLTVHEIPVRRRDPIVCGVAEMAPYVVLALARSLRLVRNGRHDVNLSHFLLPDGLVCLALERLTGLPYVVTAHGSDVPGYNPHRFTALHRLLRPLWRLVARRAAWIVCPSDTVRRLVLDACPDARTTVIPNGIDPDRFAPDRPKQPRILAVARMLERKGVQYLIQALADLDAPFALHVVGDGPYLPALRDLARRRCVRVVFHGAVANDSPVLRELYETSRIFALPSTMENFPVVLLEAMAAGAAILTTAGTGCAEVVGDGALLVPAGDVDATRQALARLMGDAALCGTLGRTARQRVERLFAWDVVARYVGTLEAARCLAPVRRAAAKSTLGSIAVRRVPAVPTAPSPVAPVEGGNHG
jgi:glycosyltransferase involved in cell wall biosynthesis